MKSCCKISNKISKKTMKCKRKDGKIFNLPRRFSKNKCTTRKIKGFTMRSSCAPYKYCKKRNKTTRPSIKKQNKKIRNTKKHVKKQSKKTKKTRKTKKNIKKYTKKQKGGAENDEKKFDSKLENCSNKTDAISYDELDNLNNKNVIKFKPNQQINSYSCYDKDVLKTYITTQLRSGKSLNQILDPLTNVPLGQEFIVTNYPELNNIGNEGNDDHLQSEDEDENSEDENSEDENSEDENSENEEVPDADSEIAILAEMLDDINNEEDIEESNNLIDKFSQNMHEVIEKIRSTNIQIYVIDRLNELVETEIESPNKRNKLEDIVNAFEEDHERNNNMYGGENDTVESLECSICLEAIDKEKNDSILTHCNHYFHKNCLKSSCKVNEKCPYCRENIKEECELLMDTMDLTEEEIIDAFNRSASWSGENQEKFEKIALKEIKKPNFNPNLETTRGSLLHIAYLSKNNTVFEELLKHPDIDVEKEDNSGRTVMNLVIAERNEYVYKLFKKYKKLHKKYKGLL